MGKLCQPLAFSCPSLYSVVGTYISGRHVIPMIAIKLDTRQHDLKSIISKILCVIDKTIVGH